MVRHRLALPTRLARHLLAVFLLRPHMEIWVGLHFPPSGQSSIQLLLLDFSLERVQGRLQPPRPGPQPPPRHRPPARHLR
ncbi:hypothetical protein EV2_018872 [Malus domestica]